MWLQACGSTPWRARALAIADAYKGTGDDRQKVYDENLKHWGLDWIVLPNPSYGSFEAVPYQFNYQTSPEAMRAAKRGALDSWSGQ